MTRGRFDLLTQLLACSNPAKGLNKIKGKMVVIKGYFFKKNHPLYPIQYIWDTVASACFKNYNPKKELSLDEAMVKYKGQKLPSDASSCP